MQRASVGEVVRVVNFFGGPGAGKSTMAAELFGHMKRKRMNVEYASEYAKDLVWRKSGSLEDQLYVFAKQQHKLYMLQGQVDYVITDSPLLLSLYYVDQMSARYPESLQPDWKHDFKNFIRHTNLMYDNINFEVVRGDRKYVTAGRYQTEGQAKAIDLNLHELIRSESILCWSVDDVETVIEVLGV